MIILFDLEPLLHACRCRKELAVAAVVVGITPIEMRTADISEQEMELQLQTYRRRDEVRNKRFRSMSSNDEWTTRTTVTVAESNGGQKSDLNM